MLALPGSGAWGPCNSPLHIKPQTLAEATEGHSNTKSTFTKHAAESHRQIQTQVQFARHLVDTRTNFSYNSWQSSCI